MTGSGNSIVVRLAFSITVLIVAACQPNGRPAGTLDEAAAAKRTPSSFTAAAEDYFRDMDGGLALTQDEVTGRNSWIVWTGGNDRFWDQLTTYTFGSFDLLRILSSYPGQKFDRGSRWHYLGLVNEPCFDAATGPDPNRYGLWLDRRSATCPADPFEDASRYPGVATGARDESSRLVLFYGQSSGIVGLRLFPTGFR